MVHLNDWLTTPQIPFASKITSTRDHYLHDHNFFEIFYVTEGSIAHSLNGQKTVLQLGDIYFLNPEDQHAFLREKGNTCAHRDIVIRKSFFRTICNFISPDFYTQYTLGEIPKKLHVPASKIKEFEEIFTRLSTSPSTKADFIMSIARITFVHLLGMLVNSSIEQHFHYPVWFQDLLDRFNDSTLLKEGLDAILEDAFYSQEHICRMFRKHLGMTMTEYLNEKRLDHAVNLLIYDSVSISQICNELGFSSISYFNKIFKQKFGITPSTFRKNATKDKDYNRENKKTGF